MAGIRELRPLPPVQRWVALSMSKIDRIPEPFLIADTEGWLWRRTRTRGMPILPKAIGRSHDQGYSKVLL